MSDYDDKFRAIDREAKERVRRERELLAATYDVAGEIHTRFFALNTSRGNRVVKRADRVRDAVRQLILELEEGDR